MSRNRTALFALVSLMAFGAHAANDAPLTREQVRAEYLQARSEGRLPPSGEVGEVFQVSPSTSQLTRAEVLRELATSGPVPTAEGSDLGNSRASLSLRSRAEVHAEAVEATRSGARPGGEL